MYKNIEKMKEAAAYIVGEHDFKSFCCVRTQAESTDYAKSEAKRS